MDDFFNMVPAAASEAPERKKTFGEELTQLLGFLVFPLLTFFAVSGGFAKAALILPPLLAGVTFAVARWLRARTSITTLATVVCLLASFAAGVVGVALATF